MNSARASPLSFAKGAAAFSVAHRRCEQLLSTLDPTSEALLRSLPVPGRGRSAMLLPLGELLAARAQPGFLGAFRGTNGLCASRARRLPLSRVSGGKDSGDGKKSRRKCLTSMVASETPYGRTGRVSTHS